MAAFLEEEWDLGSGLAFTTKMKAENCEKFAIKGWTLRDQKTRSLKSSLGALR